MARRLAGEEVNERMMAKRPGLFVHKNKSFGQQFLPSRHALNELTKGDPAQRSLGNYSKATPGVGMTGANFVQGPQRDSSDNQTNE